MQSFWTPTDTLSITSYSADDKTHSVRDKDIKNGLTAEAAMCWTVQGAVRYSKRVCLKWPKCCQDAMTRFTESIDSLGEFY